jgi:hypothetical protein
LLGKPGTSSDPIALATKEPTRVNIPASIDSAKAAVGFFSTFTANVHPYNYAPCQNYQSTVTLTCEEGEPSMLCRNIGLAKHVGAKREIPFSIFPCFASREILLDPPGADKNAYSVSVNVFFRRSSDVRYVVGEALR